LQEPLAPIIESSAFEPFIKKQYGVDVASLPTSKEELKAAYEKDKGSEINGAESSVINELYNQLANVHSC